MTGLSLSPTIETRSNISCFASPDIDTGRRISCWVRIRFHFKSRHDDAYRKIIGNIFLALRKAGGWRDGWSVFSPRAFIRRESAHPDAIGPHW